MTREPEWDDFERAKMQALLDYEAEVCDCGLHRSEADKDPDLEITINRCPVCAGKEKQHRILQADDAKKVGDKPPPGMDLPTDGRRLGLRFIPPKGPKTTR